METARQLSSLASLYPSSGKREHSGFVIHFTEHGLRDFWKTNKRAKRAFVLGYRRRRRCFRLDRGPPAHGELRLTGLFVTGFRLSSDADQTKTTSRDDTLTRGVVLLSKNRQNEKSNENVPLKETVRELLFILPVQLSS